MQEITSKIVAEILEKKTQLNKKLLIVGIEGKGCSGKSTLSHSIKSGLHKLEIPSETVSIDDFCNPRSIRYDEGVPLGLQVYTNNFNDKYFLESVVRSAFDNESLEFNSYTLDVATDEYTNHIVISLPHGGVLLIEGLHILKNKYFQYIDYSVYLHISDEEQLKRASTRDKIDKNEMPEEILYKYKNRFVPSYNHFIETDKPFEKANIIVSLESLSLPLIISREDTI